MRLAFVSGQGAAGTAYMTYALTNVGSGTCTLFGYPGVAILDGAGQIVQHPAQRGYDAFVAEKFVETHSADLSNRRQESVRVNRCQNFFVDCFGRAQRRGRRFARACCATRRAQHLRFNLMNSLAR